MKGIDEVDPWKDALQAFQKDLGDCPEDCPFLRNYPGDKVPYGEIFVDTPGTAECLCSNPEECPRVTAWFIDKEKFDDV